MTRQDLEAIRKNNAAVVQSVCREYGLYGNVVFYEPSPIADSSMNRMYVVAGLDPSFARDPFPKLLRPDEMLRAIQRNDRLFYPRAWVMDLLDNKEEIAVIQSLTDYASKASFISGLYAQYGLPAPVALRESEVHQLIRFQDVLDSPVSTPAMKSKAKKDIDWFFRREKSKSKFRQNWLRYFRSEKFPDDKGPLAKIRGYLRREKSETSLHQLMDTNKDVSKLEMQEYEFKIFQKLIQERYPFVTYAVGDKSVVDHGINKATQRDDSPFGKCVTAEEYAVVRKERFAEEGWDCVANLKPAYWEFRDIFYKDCDEPLIASIYQHITLQYAKCDSLGDLKKLGPMRLQKVPVNDFMNFVSLAKANKMRFYIDTLGEYEKSSLDTVNVLYSECQQKKMDGVVQRMIDDKVTLSHVVDMPDHPSLNSKIYEIEEKNRQSSSHPSRRISPHEK